MKAAYTSPWIAGQWAIDRIVEAKGCSDLDAWRAFRDAAADGLLRVRRLGEREPVPLIYWDRAELLDYLYVMTDLPRLKAWRADVEQVWSLAQSAEGGPIEAPLVGPRKKSGRPPTVARALKAWWSGLPDDVKARLKESGTGAIADTFTIHAEKSKCCLPPSRNHLLTLIRELKRKTKCVHQHTTRNSNHANGETRLLNRPILPAALDLARDSL